MFLATSITLVSAKDDRVVESKSGGIPTTETFGICSINSTGNGLIYFYFPYDFTGKRLNYLEASYEWGPKGATTVIKNHQGTLTIKGNHILLIGTGKIRPKFYNLTGAFQFMIPKFVGKYKFPTMGREGRMSLKGVAYDVQVTYYT